MKKILCILLLVAMLLPVITGCSSPDPTKIQSEFLTLIQEPASEETVSEIGQYLDKNLIFMETENADQMVIVYEDYIFTYDSDNLIYREFTERYTPYISDPLKALYEIKIEEQENPMEVDSVLQMSWGELCEHARMLEVFIIDNRDYKVVKEEAVWIYENYIDAILKGKTGTPIFNPKNNLFSSEAKEAYYAFAAESPDTTVTWVINEYFAYLNSIKFSLNYKNETESKVFFETCSYLVSEAGKRVAK